MSDEGNQKGRIGAKKRRQFEQKKKAKRIRLGGPATPNRHLV
jgi:hypothetical protein